MAQSINELERREKALDECEESLNRYAREIQERERAVLIEEARQAKSADTERLDYLFDLINQHKANVRPVVVEVPAAPQPQTNGVELLTAVMATVAAVVSVVTLLGVLM